jgi:hypothetical protein
MQRTSKNLISLPNFQTTTLQFADDTVIITPAHAKNLKLIKVSPQNFGQVSDLKTNLSKSIFLPIAILKNFIPAIQAIIQCPRINLPITYLGLPLTINKPNKQVYLRLISKAQQRYDEFAVKHLSPAGRAVLTNTILNAIPLHFM